MKGILNIKRPPSLIECNAVQGSYPADTGEQNNYLNSIINHVNSAFKLMVLVQD